MKHILKFVLSTVVVSSILSIAAASASAQSAGLANDWLRKQSPTFESVDLGGEFRVRYQAQDNFGNAANFHFRETGVDNDNAFLENLLRMHLGVKPADWVGVYIEGQHSSTSGDEQNPNPGSDILDVYQGYVDLGNAERFPLTLRVGRQALKYGDGRLVGERPWNNIGRVFDAAKARYTFGDTWVDGFFSRTVTVDDGSFNVANDYEYFYGMYASTLAIFPKIRTDLYFFGLNSGLGSATATTGSPVAGGGSPRDIYTIGWRTASVPGEFGAWDFGSESVTQFGRFKFAPAAPSLDHFAFAYHVRGGYTFGDTWGKPRVGLEYDFASGDDDPTDGDHGTFDQLLPSVHGPFGFMDVVSWQNIHHITIPVKFTPMEDLNVTLGYHAFWLASDQDFFYNVLGDARTAGGYGINTSAGKFVGSEIDLVANYKICNAASFQAGLGRFFAGSYADDSLAPLGGAADANWVYTMLTVKF